MARESSTARWRSPAVLVDAARTRLRTRVRRRRSLAFYRQFVQPDSLCFDIGANVGDRTDLFLSLGARVVAVEPQAACIDRLRQRFGDRVEIVEAALGPQAGEAELLVADYPTLSSLSPEWVAQASGRFDGFAWQERVTVPMETLDDLIRLHGTPDFCKIDVEGFELEVLLGLSAGVPSLSFEFTPERIDSRLAAIDHLAQLGMSRFNFSIGETLTLALENWIGPAEMRDYLASITSTAMFGDVYASTDPDVTRLLITTGDSSD